MQIAKVTHDRCNQPDGCDYVWLADSVTPTEFVFLCDQAQKRCLDAGRELQSSLRVADPGYHPQYELEPHRTVAEVKAFHEKKRAQFEEYQKKVRAAQIPFVRVLCSLSAGRILELHDREPDVGCWLDWGHNHGVPLKYAESELLGEER